MSSGNGTTEITATDRVHALLAADGIHVPKRRGKPLSLGATALLEFAQVPRLSTGIPSLDEAIVWLAGTIMVLVGPTGRGKSSLALQISRHHAQNLGPVLFVSAEMSYVSLAARAASQQTVSTWFEVLSGQADKDMVRRALNVENLVVLDEVNETWVMDVEMWLRHWKETQPDKVPLVVIDYLQLLPGAGEDRQRVSATVQALLVLAKTYSAGVLAISKTARGASKALRSGEMVGDDATESGAETNAIEYSAAVQLTLGKKDGDVIEVNISKNRFARGDLIVPLRVEWAHGRFDQDGKARSGEEIRHERSESRTTRSKEARQQSILDAVRVSPDGFESANAICRAVGGRKEGALAAIAELQSSGKLTYRDGRIVIMEQT